MDDSCGFEGKKKSYRKIITIGTSKGGTCAIYYGLKFKVDEIYAGACQYKVGDYLGIYMAQRNRTDYIYGMMGEGESENSTCHLNNCIQVLNDKTHQMLESNKNSKTLVHLIYSKCEHTYEDHIVHLIQDFDKFNIHHKDYVFDFKDHGQVGYVFRDLIKKIFINNGK